MCGQKQGFLNQKGKAMLEHSRVTKLCMVCGKPIVLISRPPGKSKVCLSEDGSPTECMKVRNQEYAKVNRAKIKARAVILYDPLIKPKATKRKCLGLSHKKDHFFLSLGSGNRFCKKCGDDNKKTWQKNVVSPCEPKNYKEEERNYEI